MTQDFGPILTRIVASKREEVDALRRLRPLDDWKRLAADAPAPRDFHAALDVPGTVRLIAEVKKASPSKGLIREDFDPVGIARSYQGGGAACVSVLTDAPFFQGSTAIFEAVRASIALPMLRKEFMIDPAQFYEARAMGADAVLLITSILSDDELRRFHDLAGELGMAALVETHSEGDLRRAMGLARPAILGINNRNLHDANFHTDLEHTGRMKPIVDELASGSESPLLVSESGIYTADDVARLREIGARAILVGESLMRQPDPGEAVRALMGRAAK